MMRVNKHGADWLLIRAYVQDELSAALSRLETALPMENTTFERGQIAALRKLVAFAEAPERTPDNEAENYG